MMHEQTEAHYGQREFLLRAAHAMQGAWRMCESRGFRRSEDLDFWQEGLPEFGRPLCLVEKGKRML